MEFLGLAVIILAVFLINGVIAKIEDNSPGGFENPDGNWNESIRKPTKAQVIVWCCGIITVTCLAYAAL